MTNKDIFLDTMIFIDNMFAYTYNTKWEDHYFSYYHESELNLPESTNANKKIQLLYNKVINNLVNTDNTFDCSDSNCSHGFINNKCECPFIGSPEYIYDICINIEDDISYKNFINRLAGLY